MRRPIDYDFDPLALHRAAPARYPFLLESVARGAETARYDLLLAFPGERLTLERSGELWHDGVRLEEDRFLPQLDRLWQRAAAGYRDEAAAHEWPFVGGWFLFLGYELADQVEPSLGLAYGEDPLPVAVAVRTPVALVRDHQQRQAWLMADHAAGEAEVATVMADLTELKARAPEPIPPAAIRRLDEEPPQRYLDGVGRIRDYIREGDVFQVNLSRRWYGQLATGSTASDLYAALREHNPAPFAALAQIGSAHVVSSSPERLLRLRGGVADTRPIAGTRPRHARLDDDRALEQELITHPKERAEHVMLIDLERNDLGRVCTPGSVQVDELMVLEHYAHVHHIVSNVRGELRPEVSPGQAIAAVFPGGTITGCPKVRCMQIIDQLEPEPRGAYTGSLGWLDHRGNLDLNILIRTLVVEGEDFSLRAGAGIVADSDPTNELAETRAKARGLLRALGLES